MDVTPVDDEAQQRFSLRRLAAFVAGVVLRPTITAHGLAEAQLPWTKLSLFYLLPLAVLPGIGIYFGATVLAGNYADLYGGFLLSVALRLTVLGALAALALAPIYQQIALRLGATDVSVTDGLRLSVFAMVGYWLAGLLLVVLPSRIFLVQSIGFVANVLLVWVGATYLVRVPRDRLGMFTAMAAVAWLAAWAIGRTIGRFIWS